MNAIPQRAYHNYERIQLPRASAPDRGRISDMEAYRLQKVAAERRRLAQQDANNAPRRVGAEQQRRPVQTAQRRQVQTTQRRQVQNPQTRQAGRDRSEAQGERYQIRQTGVQNIVGGRRLVPAYEGAQSYGAYNNRREYAGAPAYREQPRRNAQHYERTSNARPRQATNYGGYAKPRSYERTNQIENTAYNDVKPIAVEYVSPRKKGVVSTILLIAVVFAILSGLVIRYATISNLSYTNAQIQSQNAALQDELDKVKMENALKEDLNGIQERATQLGMYYPKDEQIEYMEPDMADTADVSSASTAQQPIAQDNAQQTATQENGIFDGIKTFFADLMEAVGSWFGK